MAISPQTSSGPGLQAGERRLRYGLNVVVSAIIATAILVFAILIAREYRGQIDLTASGVNSLSPRTTNLLANAKTPLSITALYSVPLAEDVDPVYQRRRDTISDLLDLYAAAGNISVNVVDPLRDQVAVTTMLAELSQMPAYANESQPHIEFISRFETFNQSLQSTIQSIDEGCVNLATQYPALNNNTEFGVVVIGLRNVQQAAKSIEKILTDIKAADQPRYGEAAETVTSTVTQMRGLVETARDWFTAQDSGSSNFPPDALLFFATAGEQCITLADELAALSAAGGSLEEVKLDKLLAEFADLVSRPAVLVRSDERAGVVGFDEVWPFPLDPQAPRGEGPDPDRDFAGEQAISSAILRLTQTERIGLIFVRFGGDPLLQPDYSNFNPMMGSLPNAPYQQMRDELERENFVLEEWDVKVAPTPPALEDVAKSVYIVFPPTPPQRPNPMQPAVEPGINDAQKQALYEAIAGSGMAIFMTGWQPPDQMGLSPAYAYEGYLKENWGIDVKSSHVLIRFAVSSQDESLWVPADPRNAIFMTTSDHLMLSDQHPITKPLRSLSAGFPAASPLLMITGDNAPDDVTQTPLVTISETERIWAVSDVTSLNADLRANMGTQPKPEDIRTPATIACAAEKTNGDKTERIAVFSSEQFASDDIALAMSLGMQGDQLVTFQAYPANRDLLINTLHWLTGDAARIAIGPQRGGVPTLDKLTAGPTVSFLKAFTVGIMPALALLAGGIVWLFRRS